MSAAFLDLSELFDPQGKARDSDDLKKSLFAFILDAWNESAPLVFGKGMPIFDKSLTLEEFCTLRGAEEASDDACEAFHAIGTTYNKAASLVELGDAAPESLYVTLPRLIKLLRRPATPYEETDLQEACDKEGLDAKGIPAVFLDYMFWQTLKFLKPHPGFTRVPAEETMVCEQLLEKSLVAAQAPKGKSASLSGPERNL